MIRGLIAWMASGACVAPALGQLAEDQVLVVYDSRHPDSLAVAEFYAGSGKVPGGAGGEPGVHPRVHVFDLETSGAPLAGPKNISYERFDDRIRDPLRAFLVGEGLVRQIRCIVLTKDMPHRIQDSDNSNVGDLPGQMATEFLFGDANAASVDNELTLLWTDLDAGEAGIGGDSLSDGLVMNPYHASSRPISSFSNANIDAPKAWVAQGSTLGRYWRTDDDAPPAEQLTPGDMYLVVRLDGNSVQDVRDMVNRARGFVYNVDTAGFVFDESDSNGIADESPNAELDNQTGLTRLEDDFESARDVLLADGRFNPARIRYDAERGVNHFIVGPRVDYGGEGLLVTTPLILLSHYGSNHAGPKPDGAGVSASSTFAESFNYAPGAIFNTVESYNARAFGGLPTLYNQEQLADFISAGGTFGIGHCWEPLATTVADSAPIVRNFVLGTMSWAEAAYTAVPALSWHYIIVGDPLARAVRSSEDINGDGRIDIEDDYAWHDHPIDLNRDGAANAQDKALLERSIRGSVFEDLGARER